ncbi:MAG: hypothetical protein PHE67_00995 [Campylobacterales bacterium]|nr:hypothetical protein [Campylobacterales bacterium]
MGKIDILNGHMHHIFKKSEYEIQNARVVPNAEALRLKNNHGKSLTTTVLYIDLRGYSKLFKTKQYKTIGKIISAYHFFVGMLVKEWSGQIVSYMGDGILAVFEPKNSEKNAVRCAMQIKYYFDNFFKTILNTNYAISDMSYGIGLANGDIMAIRTGTVAQNDITWIASCVKDAVRIGDRLSGRIGITPSMFDMLPDNLRHGDMYKDRPMFMPYLPLKNEYWVFENDIYTTNYHIVFN